MSQVDLHLHTTASDGKYSPAELVRLARSAGLRYIAITDHDSIDGIREAQEEARKLPGMLVIGGVEINTDTPGGEIHVLGYRIESENGELKQTLERLRRSRVERAEKMVARLKEMGIDIDYRRVKELAGEGAVGRPHIAEAMLEKGYISNIKEAFLKYIGRDGPAYVERDKITPVEAVQLITRAHGIAVLAHPFTSNDFQQLTGELVQAGLKGIEAYYAGYTPEQIGELLALAEKYHLIVTGGSDFHGLDPAVEPPLGSVEVPLDCVEKLMALKTD
jgi:predicted metal-dependent phosphoesterase TrpH